MGVAFQVLLPGVNFDLSRGGRGPSRDWFFFSCYNTEQASTLLEVNASQKDMVYNLKYGILFLTSSHQIISSSECNTNIGKSPVSSAFRVMLWCRKFSQKLRRWVTNTSNSIRWYIA
jgi:nitrous oxide reductase